ncbi:hypothetical protein Q7C36_010210 [Tachysurus vachellii]|uniref:Uncharacterized protein n=1 Tax=Tachysurus vachellii TaxID=175792 RepID=A0AA88SNG1_TACVA|nr:hypothetical protein Q7C36_010210 [Tachysurus vachellii]
MAGLGLMLTQRSCRAGRFSQRPLLLFPDSLIISSAGANHMLWRSAQAHFLFCQPIGCWKHRDTLENMKPSLQTITPQLSGRFRSLGVPRRAEDLPFPWPCVMIVEMALRGHEQVFWITLLSPCSHVHGVASGSQAEQKRSGWRLIVLSPYTPYCTSPCVSLFVELFGFTVR